MAEGAWRCSQCGTVNEPVANACRTCGRWPSLFELEGSTIEVEQPARVEEKFPAEKLEVEEVEPETFEPEAPPVELPPEFEDEGEEGVEKSRWRVFARLVVPIGVAVYILVSAVVDR